MTDYADILDICRKNSEISSSFLDNFLINFCADREGLEKLFMDDFKPFRYMSYTMPEGWVKWTISQYIAFRLFRKDGTASEYIKLPNVALRCEDELSFMSYAIEHPWKYTFFSVVEVLENHFYTMLDVLENETFLIYSPSISEILELNDSIQLFFNLIWFNGRCWQSFGPNSYFKSFFPSDLLYFAKNLDEDITFLNQIPELIEYDPVPWIVLFKSGEIQLSFQKDLIVINSSEYYEEQFEPDEYDDIFKIERKYPLYKLSLKRWNRFPHFASCYYHKKLNRFILTAFTDRGYEKLIEAFRNKGYELPTNPEFHVTPGMLSTARDLLGEIIELNPYEKSFEVSEENPKEINHITAFLDLLMEAHNNNRKIDIDYFAKVAGLDKKSAYNIADEVMKTFDKK